MVDPESIYPKIETGYALGLKHKEHGLIQHYNTLKIKKFFLEQYYNPNDLV